MASPFSFHCMICIEEFDQRDRYPVVLPCGHTYVCNQCAERLTKCMECREPLLIAMEPPPPSTGSASQPTLFYRPAGALPSDRSRGRLIASGRGARFVSPQAAATAGRAGNRPVPVPKKRLPLPKNVVLMSLMEATDAVASQQPSSAHLKPVSSLTSPSFTNSISNTNNNNSNTNNNNSNTNTNTNTNTSINNQSPNRNISMMDEEEMEEEKIRFSTSLIASACGTYAVTSKEGIRIFPSKPSDIADFHMSDDDNDPRGSTFTENEDIDAMVRFFHLDRKMAINSNNADNTTANTAPAAAAVKLSRGDRLQIVSIDDGWAKLARGYGYVRADHGEVAKVGNAADRACKLEAFLRSISMRRRELREEQRKADAHFVQLMQDLQTSLLTDEDLTVIGAETFKGVENSTSPKSSRDKENENCSSEAKRPPESSDNEFQETANNEARAASTSPDNSLVDMKPHRMIRVDSPNNIVPTSLGCFSQDFFSDFRGESASDPSTPDHIQELSASAARNSCMISGIMGALSFPDESFMTEANNSSARVISMTEANNSAARVISSTPQQPSSHPSPRAMSAGARAWREQHNRPASSAIDFKTGMSGHMALLSTQSNYSNNSPLDYLRGSGSSWSWGRMSSHTGLTLGTSRREPKASPPPSPNNRRSYDYEDSRTI